MGQALKRFPSLQARIIPLGINKRTSSRDSVQPRWTLKKNTPVICYLSRLHPKKGLELLLQALSLIDNDFQLLIAGTGETGYEASLRELIATLKQEEKCHFLGFIEGGEKQLLLQSSDIFALTSYSENFGIAVLEAMAAGAMPFISHEVALSGIVKEHNLGVVCKLSVQDIKRKLSTQLQNIEGCKQRGNAAKKFVEQHYQWSAIAQQLQDLYLELKH
jgi:glycosyltransferase involved in cell wall biosynthesis